jgi:type IV secretory pathway VirB10-like protein
MDPALWNKMPGFLNNQEKFDNWANKISTLKSFEKFMTKKFLVKSLNLTDSELLDVIIQFSKTVQEKHSKTIAPIDLQRWVVTFDEMVNRERKLETPQQQQLQQMKMPHQEEPPPDDSKRVESPAESSSSSAPPTNSSSDSSSDSDSSDSESSESSSEEEEEEEEEEPISSSNDEDEGYWSGSEEEDSNP